MDLKKASVVESPKGAKAAKNHLLHRHGGRNQSQKDKAVAALLVAAKKAKKSNMKEPI